MITLRFSWYWIPGAAGAAAIGGLTQLNTWEGWTVLIIYSLMFNVLHRVKS